MKKHIAAFLLVLVLLVPCLASAVTYYRVTADSLRLWAGPNYESKIKDSYRRDWALTIDKSVNSTWAEITLSNGVSGYMEKKYFKHTSSFGAWITKDNTGLKHGPADSFKTVGTLSKGDKVTVLTNGTNFSYVRTENESYGYVANSRLSRSKVKSTEEASAMTEVNYTAWITSNGGTVGLRSMPSGSNDVVFAKYSPGTEVTVTWKGDEFDYVTVKSDGYSGYIRNKYLTKKKPTTASSSFTAYDAKVVLGSDGKKAPVYQGEGLGWAVAFRLEADTIVRVVANGTDKYWVKIEYGTNNYYYMQKKYLKKVN